MLINIIVGIITGVVASGFFYILLTFKRPKINISRNIAKPNNDKYEIKIINKTSSDIVEIKFQFFLVKFVPRSRGATPDFTPIKIHKNELFQIDKFVKNYNSEDSHCWRVTIEENIEALLESEKDNRPFFRIIIHAKHSFSNFGRVFSEDYGRDSIKQGTFSVGNSMNIIV